MAIRPETRERLKSFIQTDKFQTLAPETQKRLTTFVSPGETVPSGGISSREEPRRFGGVSDLGRTLFGKRSTPGQVREQVSQRQDLLAPAAGQFGEFVKRGGTQFGGGSGTLPALGVVGGAAKRAEAAVATPALRLQRKEFPAPVQRGLEPKPFLENLENITEDVGNLIETGRLLFGDVVQGITGESQAEIGDVFRTAGIPENVSATLGVLATMGLTNLATQGKVVNLANKAEGIVKPTAIKVAKKTGEQIAKRRPRIFGQKWLEQQVINGRTATRNLDNVLGNSFDEITSQVGSLPVDDVAVKEAFESTFITEAEQIVLREVDDILIQTTGSPRIDTIEKLRIAKQIVRKRTPQRFFTKAGRTGKGGLANVKVRQPSLSAELANMEIQTIRTSGIENADEIANQLSDLNTFAHQEVYPTLKELRKIFGDEGSKFVAPSQIARAGRTFSPVGGSLRGAFSGRAATSAAERKFLASVPKIAKKFKGFLTSEEFGDNLLTLTRNSKQLVKDINKFKNRQLLKFGAGAAAGFAAFGRIRKPPIVEVFQPEEEKFSGFGG